MKIPDKRRKTSNLNIRVDPELKALLESKAAQHDQSLTRYLLWAILQTDEFTDEDRAKFLGSL